MKSTSMSPGKAEQVELELLKARAGTEPSAGKPSWKGETPFSLPAPHFGPSTEHPQTLDSGHNIRKIICSRSQQSEASPKPNRPERMQ